MAVRGLNHLTLAVTDLDRSVAFYRNILGCRLRALWPSGAYLESGALWLCLSLDHNPQGDRRDYTHIAFDVATEAFDDMVVRVADAASTWKENASEGASYYFLDPHGHRLELHAGDLASRLNLYRQTSPPGMVIVED